MSIERWLPGIRDQLENLCAAWQTPMGLAVSWIEVESGGRMGEVTDLDERGFFQLMPSESQDLGIDHQRLSRDPIYSLASGFKLIDYYKRVVRRICIEANETYIAAGTEYGWRIVKLAHSMGQGATRTVIRDAVTYNSTISWDMLKSYALGHDAEYLTRLKHSPAKWFQFIDRMFALGALYGFELACSSPPAPPRKPNV